MDDRLIQDGIWEEGQGSATEVAVLHDRGPSDERSHTPAPSDADADDWDIPVRLPTTPTLHLDGFDGPMDLLLDLAERQRIDFGRMSILDLAEQFVVAMERFARGVPLERRADWLVLATRLVLLRSRLLFPENPKEQQQAEEAAAAEINRLEELALVRAAAGWLSNRPQLGIETFARPQVAAPREGGYVALMEACLVMLRGPDRTFGDEPVYMPAIPDLWRVTDALARIAALLAVHPGGGDLAAFLPPIASDDPNRTIRARTALGSTFLAGLELAREGALTITQEEPMAECWMQAAC
jgi:segregation and condensation protein A